MPNDAVRIRVQALGTLNIRVDGEPLAFGRKLPRKPLALLKCLVAHGGDSVPQQRLIHAVWPGETADSGYHAFWLALHRLRRLLGDATTIDLTGGRLSLRREQVWVDAHAFEQALDADDRGTDAIDEALRLYRGPLLDGDDEHSCVLLARERLRRKFAQAVLERARALEDEGRHEEARRLFQRGLDADAVSETFHQGLIRCLLEEGRVTDALCAYRRLRQLLSVTLGRMPSHETDSLIARAGLTGAS